MALSRAATEAALRRSRIEAEVKHELETDVVVKENALRRSRAKADVAAEEAAVRRSRLEEEISSEMEVR